MKYVIFWNAVGKLNYAPTHLNYHKGLNVVCYVNTNEQADEYIKRHTEYFKKVNAKSE